MERTTRQRTAVLEEISGRSDHPTARDIYLAVKKTLPKISLTTVYRNLFALADEGLILRIAVPGAAERFDFNPGIHLHLLCEHCGAFGDVTENKNLFEQIQTHVLQKDNFFVSGMDLVIKGRCGRCRRLKDAPGAL